MSSDTSPIDRVRRQLGYAPDPVITDTAIEQLMADLEESKERRALEATETVPLPPPRQAPPVRVLPYVLLTLAFFAFAAAGAIGVAAIALAALE